MPSTSFRSLVKAKVINKTLDHCAACYDGVSKAGNNDNVVGYVQS